MKEDGMARRKRMEELGLKPIIPLKLSPRLERRRQREEMEARRAVISRYLLEHKTDEQIAKLTGYPIRQVRTDITGLLTQWQETQARNADTYFTTDLLSLNTAQDAIMAEVKKGNFSAIDRLLDIFKRRADMLGYDKSKAKGTKTDPIVIKNLTNTQLKEMPTDKLEELEAVLMGFDKEAEEEKEEDDEADAAEPESSVE